MSDLLDHASARIGTAEKSAAPFAHLYVENLFPEDVYRDLLDTLPADDLFERAAPPYEARLTMNLDSAHADPFGGAVRDVARLLESQGFLEAVTARFAEDLPDMASQRGDLLAANTVGDRVRIGSRFMLLRDSVNYELGPHTDAGRKFVVGLVYLARDDGRPEFGTSLYRPREPGFTSWRSTHFARDGFDLVRTLPYRPNSALFFAKSDVSFHGVEPGDFTSGGRNLLMWVPEVGHSKKCWGDLSLPLSVFTG